MSLQEFIKEKKWKKMQKDQWLIILLAGILLLVIAVPSDCGASSKEEKKAAAEKTKQTQSDADYEAALEQRLKQTLERIDGVGQVQVMITLKDEGETVVEKDISSTGDTQANTDGEGNRTEETKSERTEETVYSSQSSDGEPFVSKKKSPQIEGVLVVAQGGGNTKVAENISEAVEALFSVEAHKIKVVKMNSQEGSN